MNYDGSDTLSFNPKTLRMQVLVDFETVVFPRVLYQFFWDRGLRSYEEVIAYLDAFDLVGVTEVPESGRPLADALRRALPAITPAYEARETPAFGALLPF